MLLPLQNIATLRAMASNTTGANADDQGIILNGMANIVRTLSSHGSPKPTACQIMIPFSQCIINHESAARAALLATLSHVWVGGEAAVGGAAMCNSGGGTETSLCAQHRSR